MKAKMFWLWFSCLLVFPFLTFAECETPEEKTYTHIRARFAGIDVFSGQSLLANVGYTCEHSIVAQTKLESGILYQIGVEGSDYGGLLMIEAHGVIDGNGNLFLLMEVFPGTDAGLMDAQDRVTFLSQALYSVGDLQVRYSTDESAYGVFLTEQGISNNFSGSNGLVVLAACYGNNAFGLFGGTRLTIGCQG